VALDNNSSALAETVRYVENIVGDNVPFSIKGFECDVTKVDSVENAIESTVRSFGTPDYLWNNAGYQGQIKTTLDYCPEDFARVMNINVTGLFIVLQAVAKRMVAANESKNQGENSETSYRYAIVNTASVAALRGTPAMVAYSSSKAAVLTMTVSAAKDLAPHQIRVNAVSPALIGPGYMWTRQNELHATSSSPYYPTNPEDVAKAKIKRYGHIFYLLIFFLLHIQKRTLSYNVIFNCLSVHCLSVYSIPSVFP